MPLIILASDAEHGFVSPSVLGISDIVQDNMVYLVEITEIIAFRENPLPNDYEDGLVTWGDGSHIWYGIDIGAVEWDTGFFETRRLGDYRILQYALFDKLGMREDVICTIPFYDSEDDQWNRLIYWDKNYEYVNDLEDFSLPNRIYQILGIQDLASCFILLSSAETECWDYDNIWNDNLVFE